MFVITPVEELYEMPAPVESDVEPSFPLKVFQSVEVRSPRLADDALGRLNVTVEPVPVMVKSLPVVEVANTTAGPVVVCPTGPMEVRPEIRQVPLTAKQPAFKLIPPVE